MTIGVSDGSAGPVPANALIKQKVSILVVRGHPRDTQATRSTKLCVTCQSPQSASVDHIFELAGTRPYLSIKEVSGPTPLLANDPRVVRDMEVATISTTAAQRDTLLTTLRAISVSTEWDHRNWLDDVLRRLQITWPVEFADDAMEPLIIHATDLILQAPEG